MVPWCSHEWCSHEVPRITLEKLGRNLDMKVRIRWWGENNYSALHHNLVETLARNKVDECRANIPNHISQMYHLAIIELINIT